MMRYLKHKCLILLAVAICAFSATAQRDKNYIYLFDCTGSMIENGLWEPAKSALDKNIALRAQIPSSNFTVIPFGDDNYDTFSFDGSRYGSQKANMGKAFDQNIKKAKYTNINGVLKSGFASVKPNDDNEIYLFTDGKPTSRTTTSTELSNQVAATIIEWCANHRNTRLFYVALTPEAINPIIRAAIDACPDAKVIEPKNGIIPVIADISNRIFCTTEELPATKELDFSIPGTYGVAVEQADSLFAVEVAGNRAADGKLRLTVKSLTADPHQTLQGGEYQFPVAITSTDPGIVIADPMVTVTVSDQTLTSLTIANGADCFLEPDAIEWYDSFLWCKAKEDIVIIYDLNPIFGNPLPHSVARLKFEATDGHNDDFQAFFNKKMIKNGAIIELRPGEPAVIDVLFDHDAAQGKHYFRLTPVNMQGIDVVNDQPAEEYTGTDMRAKYKVVWNPLKLALVCLLILLVAALILWLLVLKRIFYPTIKLGRVVMTGPGSYYQSKKLKGARKVVLTSRRRKQGLFSRIFTGEIRYVCADHFYPELAIIPSGNKKKVKFAAEGKKGLEWDCLPSSIFAPYEKGTIVNRRTGDKTEMEFS